MAGAGGVQGIVAARPSPSDSGDYGVSSETLVRGAPLAAFRELIRAEDSGPRLRAADLVAELNLINAQVHRIMSQVEKAVSRLVTTAS